ncbi:MAG: NADH-quinone oxidoreductase subunit NuoE [Desulfovibrionaceae bacterium]|nr:NADH-quinone oxidoreductase subunit NuoE [Desulfovibrionaceae bacterium]
MRTMDSAEIAAFLRTCPRDKSHSLAILQDIQRRYGYIPREVFAPLASLLGVKAASLYALATFYKALSVTPKGRHIIKVCDGTACHIRGAVSLVGALERALGISAGETSPDGLFTVETVNCLGACALAPVMVVDETYFPKTTPEKIREILEQYRISGSRSGGGYG